MMWLVAEMSYMFYSLFVHVTDTVVATEGWVYWSRFLGCVGEVIIDVFVLLTCMHHS